MKYKMIALMLALTIVSWAQTPTQSAPSSAPPSATTTDKEKCPCCEKTATANDKDAAHCPHHSKKSQQSKEMTSCCKGKDAKSCMRKGNDKAGCCGDSCGRDKTAAGCNGTVCAKECGKTCCSSKTEKAATNCCRGRMHS